MRYAPFLLLLLSLGCQRDPTMKGLKAPIEKEKFINILVDMHLIDAITTESEFFRKYDPDDSISLYEAVYKKYDITRELLDSTIAAYTRHPELYMEVYDQVLFKLNYLSDSLEQSVSDGLKLQTER